MKRESIDRAAGSGDRSGFSLIELAIAIAITSIVMAGAYTLISQAGFMQKLAHDHYLAVNIAQSRLERAKNVPYDTLPLMAENNVIVDNHGNPDNSGSFRRTTTVNAAYTTNSTEMVVSVDIKNMNTATWGPGNETVSSIYTEYLEFGP